MRNWAGTNSRSKQAYILVEGKQLRANSKGERKERVRDGEEGAKETNS